MVDQLSAQIEALTRDITSLILHKYDINYQLASAIRTIKLAIRMLASDVPEYVYERMERTDYNVVKEHLCTCECLLQKTGQMIAEAMMQRVLSDFQLKSNIKVMNSNETTVGETKKCDDVDDIGVDFFKTLKEFDGLVLKEPEVDTNKFLKNCTNLARYGCNQAHQMQNYMGPYTRINPGKDTANRIINLAGQCENHWREIQSHLRNFDQQREGNANLTALSQTLVTNMEKQLTGVMTNIEEISKCADMPKEVFVKGELKSIEAVSAVSQSLVSVVKGNLKLQFAK